MHPFHSAYSDLPPAPRPLWHVGIGIFVVGAVLGCLLWLLMNSLAQKPRQQCPCQCSCDAYDAAHQTAPALHCLCPSSTLKHDLLLIL